MGSKKRKKRGGDQDFDRSALKSAVDPMNKLDLILCYASKGLEIGEADRTESLSKFLSDVGLPMSQCLNNHFNGNKQETCKGSGAECMP